MTRDGDGDGDGAVARALRAVARDDLELARFAIARASSDASDADARATREAIAALWTSDDARATTTLRDATWRSRANARAAAAALVATRARAIEGAGRAYARMEAATLGRRTATNAATASDDAARAGWDVDRAGGIVETRATGGRRAEGAAASATDALRMCAETVARLDSR